MTKQEQIIEDLKQKGYRITQQRRMLIEIILSSQGCTCKEIYYQAKKADGSVGIATVYRTLALLEDEHIIVKKNHFDVIAS